MNFNSVGPQRDDKQQDVIFSSYLGPPSDEVEEEESPFFNYMDQVAKVAFINGVIALVLTYFAKGVGRPGIVFAMAYFLGVFLGLIILPVLLSLVLALPGLFFKRYKQVFKIIFISLWIASIVLTCVFHYLINKNPDLLLFF
jgi:hypothetical protein